ncbi:type I-C CRISPR-associated protein Cas7/Csd2 [Magnetospirillum sp. UT-4]|uniref:type I-C CRISPR-associated protein Cas7/Csd2 n=1 Tax=Magnetospirillum sp. UT-4 TaxID=2681467 RepID=UPI001385831D|nr:type I-C CRISPR-associated protein Cas7/Csd2 [Magnetospirillum sp. UT-4]CAA7622824.1 CRISPR-associated protein, Csd2 family [Magnetospirillum sp. UT-4]
MTSPVISNRYDFVLLFDVKDGNPNGDPDAGNQPRIDPETGQGLVTDVAIKRKIRNYVGLKTGNTPPNAIYVREGAVLQEQRKDAYIDLKDGEKASEEKARARMCANFFDVRTFGAVMSTKKFNAGQVRGPVQITFARSVNRILPADHTITRVARETEARAAEGGSTEMGGKSTVAYGLYRASGFISPHLAQGDKGTGFTEADLALLWEALGGMFDLDRSAARGLMSTRRLIAFRHDSLLGNARAETLLERVTVAQNADTPRAWTDFTVSIDRAGLPAGVEVLEVL